MIKEIEFDNEILGNLKLDFKKSDGSPYKTIILAGNNGCGKTTIFNYLAKLFTENTFIGFKEISYKFGDSNCKLIKDPEAKHPNYVIQNIDGNMVGRYLFDENSDKLPRNFGFAYSKSRSGFAVKPVNQVGSMDIDTKKIDPDVDDYTDIKKLFIDINTKDAIEFMKFAEKTKDDPLNKYISKTRMYRFSNAFNNFFTNIRFEKIGDAKNGDIEILFKKNDKLIDIDDLSTGEKQIVFRGGRLLSNKGNMQKSIVLIDEPELSLHPQWQRKIYQYYKSLFCSDSNQIAQIIMATHSTFVIEEALRDEDALVICLKDDCGKIIQRKIDAPDALDSITAAEINYLAFDICSTDYHIALFAKYQNLVCKSKISEIDDSIFAESRFDSAQYGKVYTFGNRTYKTLPIYIRNCIDHPDNAYSFSDEELIKSTRFLRELIFDRQ